MKRFINFLESKYRVDASHFVYGGTWNTFSQIIVLFSSLIVSIVLTRELSENDFGTYRYLISLGLILSAFSLTGLGHSILQATARKNVQFFRKTFVYHVLYSTPLILISLIGSSYYLYAGNYVLSIGCLLIALLHPWLNIFNNILPFLRGGKRYKESTLVETVNSFIVGASLITTIFFTQNILVLFLVFLVSNIITKCCAYFFFVYRDSKTELTLSTEDKRYLKYAKHLSLQNVMGALANRADSILIFQQLGAAELALYTVANMLPEQLKGTVKNLSGLLLQKYSSSNEQHIIQRGIPKRTTQIFLVLSAFTLLYILLSAVLYPLVYPKYPDAVLLTQIFALSFPAMAAVVPMSSLKARLDEKKLYKLQIFSSITTLSFLAVGILLFGVIGAVAGRVMSRYANLFFSYRFSRQTS